VILTVLTFRAADAADEAVAPLRQLAAAGELRIADAAVVSWAEGHRKPSARPLGDLTGGGLLWGGSWGVLLALLFVVPIAGPTFGAAAAAFAGALAEFGIDDAWVKRVREAVTPGTSAIFVLADRDVTGALPAVGMDAIEVTFSPEQERRVRAVLAEEPAAR
jgi:uncharacterized membrane protein